MGEEEVEEIVEVGLRGCDVATGIGRVTLAGALQNLPSPHTANSIKIYQSQQVVTKAICRVIEPQPDVKIAAARSKFSGGVPVKKQ